MLRWLQKKGKITSLSGILSDNNEKHSETIDDFKKTRDQNSNSVFGGTNQTSGETKLSV